MEQSAQRKILIDHPWINKNLFESIFKEESIKFNEICSFTVDLASKGAENFSSELMTATVYYEPEIDDEGSNETGNTKSSSGIVLEKNFIIKARSQLIRSRDVCKKEIWMYAYVIPMLENAFAHVGRILNLAPYYYSGSVIGSFMVLENLKDTGFINIDRKTGLKLAELKATIVHLTKMHAASVSVAETGERYILYEKPHIHLTGSTGYRALFENAVITCAEAFQHELPLISEKLFAFKNVVFAKCCEAVERDDTEFNVLTHGDLWVNNIMFKYDQTCGNGDAPVDIKFIDFQNGYYGSPILDLAYLLFTSSVEDVTGDDWDDLIEFYYDELRSAVTYLKIRGNIPEKHEFMSQVFRRGLCGAVFSLFTIMLRKQSEDDAGAVIRYLGNAEENLQYRRSLVLRPEIRSSLKNNLLYFNEKGFFN